MRQRILLGSVVALVVIGGGVALLFNFRGDPTVLPLDTPPTTSSAASGSEATTLTAASTERETTTTATAPSTVESVYTPEFVPARCEFPEPDGVEVQCGFVTVPEDRQNADGTQIRLHVAHFLSPVGDAATPVVYLEGGPGGEILEALEFGYEDRFAPIVATRDLVLFDQRGTGYSQPSLACGAYRQLGLDLMEQHLSDEELVAAEREVLEQCRAGYVANGIDLAQYNSAENAADVDDIRQALGIEEWHLWGISYGTRLALTVMRDRPDGTVSVVLDSTYPPEVDGLGDFIENARRAFDVLFDACANDAACAAEYGDLESRLYALVDRMNAEPVRAPVFDFFTGVRYDAVVTGDDLMGLVFQSLYSELMIPLIPDLIDGISEGRTGDLGNLISVFLANGEFISIGMHLSVQCNEEVPFGDVAAAVAAAAADPYVAMISEDSVTQSSAAPAFCQGWGSGTADAVEALAVDSDVPTLVMAGTYDPITPPEDGAAVAAHLTNAWFVEFPTLGHGVSTAEECPLDIMLSFLDDPGSAPDTSCVSGMEPPQFVAGPVSGDVQLEAVEDSSAGISGVAPLSWEQAGVGTWARSADALDQTSVLQLGVPGFAGQFLAATIETQLGLEDVDELGTLEGGGRTWTRRTGTFQGYVADVCFTDSDVGGLVVVLITDPNERDELVETVLLPALEAIESR